MSLEDETQYQLPMELVCVNPAKCGSSFILQFCFPCSLSRTFWTSYNIVLISSLIHIQKTVPLIFFLAMLSDGFLAVAHAHTSCSLCYLRIHGHYIYDLGCLKFSPLNPSHHLMNRIRQDWVAFMSQPY